MARQAPRCIRSGRDWTAPEHSGLRAEYDALLGEVVELLKGGTIAPVPLITEDSRETEELEETRGFFKKRTETSYTHVIRYESLGEGWLSSIETGSDTSSMVLVGTDGRMFPAMPKTIGPVPHGLKPQFRNAEGEYVLTSEFALSACSYSSVLTHRHRVREFLGGEVHQATKVAALFNLEICPVHHFRHPYYWDHSSRSSALDFEEALIGWMQGLPNAMAIFEK